MITETNPKGAGRKKLDKHGKMVWVQSDFVELVEEFLNMLKSAKANLRR
jgi:hypothetical protein